MGRTPGRARPGPSVRLTDLVREATGRVTEKPRLLVIEREPTGAKFEVDLLDSAEVFAGAIR